MEIKKSPKADLESKKLTFALIGLVVTLFVVWRVFEYKSYDKQTVDNLQRTVEVIEEEMVEITKQEQPKVQPPQPKPQVTQIQVVEDDVEVEDEILNRLFLVREVALFVFADVTSSKPVETSVIVAF